MVSIEIISRLPCLPTIKQKRVVVVENIKIRWFRWIEMNY